MFLDPFTRSFFIQFNIKPGLFFFLCFKVLLLRLLDRPSQFSSHNTIAQYQRETSAPISNKQMMAALQAHTPLSSSFTSATRPPLAPLRRILRFRGSLPLRPSSKADSVSFPRMRSLIPIEALMIREEHAVGRKLVRVEDGGLTAAKLRAVAEAAADRAEIHAIIGEQRNNWGHMFLHSINSISLAASLMTGIAAIPSADASSVALNLSSAVLLTTATGLMLLVNKIQPSQLVEEQRNAARLFRQLERSIREALGCGDVHESDVEEAMEKVLALQKAYPLPLLPGMLEKFPKAVEPTRWWPKQRQQRRRREGAGRNGWGREVEQEMRGVLRVLKNKDEEQYLRFGELVLKINKSLSVVGPLLAGIAAVGAADSAGGGGFGSWTAVLGAAAAAVNTLEHGGQVGMVFELFRNCAGFYRKLEEEIELNLAEEETEMREEGELFELKMALQLGRSLSELRGMAAYAPASPSSPQFYEDIKEFAGKLF